MSTLRFLSGVIHTLCFFSVLPVLNGCSVNEQQQIYTDRYLYDRLFDINYTPDANRICHGWFCDKGSWMGFTIPQKEQWVNGFCGPFDLDKRRWMATAALTAAPVQSSSSFSVDSVNYFPGELFITSHNENTKLIQRMVYADAQTALIRFETDKQVALRFSGEGWESGTSFQMMEHCIVAHQTSGKTVCVTFPPHVSLSLTDDNYMAETESGYEHFVTISAFSSEKEKSQIIQNAVSILSNPTLHLQANRERWEGYLKTTLRDDMPYSYNRVAVKSIATLMSNWKGRKGGLLHDGVVPSHAVDYFMGFWAWDSWRFSVALADLEPELAKNQMRAMFDYQQSDGMIIDCIYVDPKENNARNSKPPLAAWAADAIFTATGDTAFIREIYPALVAYHRWWYAKRDHDRNGICEFGSTDGTLEAAAWESGMDNAIRFDDTEMLKNANDAWSMNQESVDLNVFLAMEYLLLQKLSDIIGQPFNEPDHTAHIHSYFFDEAEGFFFDRKLGTNKFITQPGCEGYAPFWTGIASKEQMEMALVLLSDSTKFSTYIPFPTIAADNPKFTPRGYWRGPIWLDQTYFAIKGLRNYGYHDLADCYTVQVFERLQGIQQDAPIYENYGTHNGESLKAPHFSWSAAHLLMLYKAYKR